MVNILRSKKIGTSFKIALFAISTLFVATSCNFFEDEWRQDKQLAYYRHQTHIIPDSISKASKRIEAYKDIIEKASDDKLLITQRKKNKLLSEIYNAMGSEYYEAKDIDHAIASTTLAIVLNITNQHAHYNRACLYQSIGKDSLAIVDYTTAIIYDEKAVDSYYNRGILYEKNTEFQLAVEDYTEAIKLKPEYLVDAYNNRGNVYQTMEFYERALNDYNKALELDSTHAITYFNRGDAYAQMENKEKAISDYKKAIQTDSANVIVKEKLESMNKQIKAQKTGTKE